MFNNSKSLSDENMQMRVTQNGISKYHSIDDCEIVAATLLWPTNSSSS